MQIYKKSEDDVVTHRVRDRSPHGHHKGTIQILRTCPVATPLAQLFAKHTTLPVVVTNDANAAAVGEMVYGGAKNMKDFVVITLYWLEADLL